MTSWILRCLISYTEHYLIQDPLIEQLPRDGSAVATYWQLINFLTFLSYTRNLILVITLELRRDTPAVLFSGNLIPAPSTRGRDGIKAVSWIFKLQSYFSLQKWGQIADKIPWLVFRQPFRLFSSSVSFYCLVLPSPGFCNLGNVYVTIFIHQWYKNRILRRLC